MTQRFVAATMLAAVLAVSDPAQAEPIRHDIAVSSVGLDLSQPADAALMAERVQAAARRACGGSPRFWPEYRLARAWTVEHFERCRSRAEAQARAALDGSDRRSEEAQLVTGK